MEIAQVSCMLRLTQNGNINMLSVPKFGPDALLVTEIPILRMINDIEEGGDEEDCCVTEIAQVDVVETTRSAEIQRLEGKYGKKVVAAAYPGGRGLPLTVEDCEVPASAYAKRRPKPKTAKADAVETVA